MEFRVPAQFIIDTTSQERAEELAAAWLAVADLGDIQLELIDNYPTIVNSLNPGSLRALAQRTAQSMVNRFGSFLKQYLESQHFDPITSYDLIERISLDILRAMSPDVMVRLYELMGYALPDPDQRTTALEGEDA